MAPDNKPRPSMDGFRRSSPPLQPQPRQPDLRPDHDLPAPEPTPLLENTEKALPEITEPIVEPKRKKPGYVKWVLIGLIAFLVAAASVVMVGYSWYQAQLAPVSSDTTKHVRVTIKLRTSPSAIAAQLKAAGVIRSELAFSIYTKLTGTEGTLKAGSYSLQPSLSTPKIVEHLVAGKEDIFNITFLPGDTVANNRKVLLGLDYPATEVDAALSKEYNRPLFATKPAGTDLEGYLYGETIQFDSSATVETILNRFFDEYEAVIQDNNLVAGFQQQGLTLYQGITLASIVQRETSNPDSQRQVARVFLNRMKAGMTLGSDVTYQYAAKKMGVAPDPSLNSPYNTRIHAGLPPGPISTPGKTALLAVANPASNDYLFFLAGDDNIMHYAKTDAEHQRNITLYCQKKCASP